MTDRQPLAREESFNSHGAVPSSLKKTSAWSAVIFAASISSMTAATLGYDVGIVAAAIDYIKRDLVLDHGQQQLVVGSLNFTSAFGTLIAGQTSDALGRKATVWICCLLYTVGTALMALAPDYGMLLLGRIVTGLGVGVSFVVAPVYISEITPSEARGMLSTTFDMSINVGILLGYLVGFAVADLGEDAMSDSEVWRCMLGLGAILPLVVMASLAYLPESPRWLMSRGREAEALDAMTHFLGDPGLAQDAVDAIQEAMLEEREEGLAALACGGTTGGDPCGADAAERGRGPGGRRTGHRVVGTGRGNAEHRPLSMGHDVHEGGGGGGGGGSEDDDGGGGEEEKEETDGSPLSVASSPALSPSSSSSSSATPPAAAASALTWRELGGLDPLPPHESYLRRVVLLVVGVGFWQQATGSEAILYYSAAFLEQAGLDSIRQRLLGYVGIGLCKLIPEAVVMWYVDSVGRRPLMLVSSLAVTVTTFAIALVFVADLPGSAVLVVALLMLYMVCFSIGMGPITWLLASEMLPSRARAKGMTACCFVNRLVSGSVALSALSTCDAFGFAGFFALYGSLGAAGTAWYCLSLPETKGKSLEEITETFKLEDAGEEVVVAGSLIGSPRSSLLGGGGKTAVTNPMQAAAATEK